MRFVFSCSGLYKGHFNSDYSFFFFAQGPARGGGADPWASRWLAFHLITSPSSLSGPSPVGSLSGSKRLVQRHPIDSPPEIPPGWRRPRLVALLSGSCPIP